MPPTSEPGRSVSSRLLQVLFAFRPGHTRLTLAALARRTGLPQATVRRLAIELVTAGALDRAPDGALTVGTRLWQLGTLAPLTEPLRTVALPFMEDLYTALQQHVQLAVLEGSEAVIVERLSTPTAVGLVSQVGGGLPLHCSAVGKVLLAHGDGTLFDAVVERGLDRFTPRTVTDPIELRRELGDCRRTGTAIVRGELTAGADSVATRIMDAEGRVVAALSVVVRSGSVSLTAAVPSVVTSGLGISRRLGWTPDVGVRAELAAHSFNDCRGSAGTR
ncbi:IclR family transcriptional regulator [Pseudonocardia hierapolitana]|uniref:IclR family transcriptional regulator n=1 Tax=Pseudonocardia hierapolitana TaxID=1128676 RepID=A0A561SJ54_9PSEU|nr:IclR family transcriptional regulator [Pseudonocardia hierapolitana]TWF74918.1 IclR family transcriptional regulator [Pseudonocardia hierapolitana]